MTPADEIYVGRDFGRHDIVIDADEVARYCDAVDDHNPIYTTNTREQATTRSRYYSTQQALSRIHQALGVRVAQAR